MRIKAGALQEEKGRKVSFQLSEPMEALEYRGQTVEFASPVKLEVEAQNTGASIWVEAELTAHLKMHCSRCLEPFQQELTVDYQEEYFRSDEIDEAPEDTENVRVELYEDDAIDLTEGVRQNLLLSVPLQPLCQPDCRGICPECGINLNQDSCDCDTHVPDPRLAGLADLLKDNDRERR